MHDQPIVLTAHEKPNVCIIWMHGLGADGSDFEALPNMLVLDESIKARFIFPHASIRPITVNGGMQMRGWYDISNLDFTECPDEQELAASVKQIEIIIEEQMAQGIAPERIILAGFSQGGVIALHAAMRSAHRFAGIMALSTYLPCLPHVPVLGCPLFMAHGFDDGVIPIHIGEEAFQRIALNNRAVIWKTYSMSHGLCEQELDDIAVWINRTLLA